VSSKVFRAIRANPLGRGKKLNIGTLNIIRTMRHHAFASDAARRRCALLAGVCAFGLAAAVALGASAATAKERYKPAHQQTEHSSREPFGDIPKGPLQIFVSIDQQKLHLYSDGVHIADTSVATGVPSLPTPLGAFSVIQKQIFHRSNLYSNAPMPFMQRITWSGVALHEGESIGHRASHGCIRMPHDFAVRLYQLTKLGARVIIADSELKPSAFADPHLFVHKVIPPAPPASAPVTAAMDPVQTAQSGDDAKTTDAVEAPKPEAPPTPPAAQQAAQPAEDLRGTDANPILAVDAAPDEIPLPLAKPAQILESIAEKTAPIAIFISRKEKRIYVRQNFEPMFDAAVVIEYQEQPLGTHVFTALEYLDDGSTFRWNVVSFPGEPPPPKRSQQRETRSERHGKGRPGEEEAAKAAGDPPPQTPAQALARIEIPQDIIDRISALIVPGSSLIVSDQGLGDETGEGTDFVVVTR
jgi:hypothetical protein